METQPSINLRDLVFLIADPSSYLCMIIHSMLRSFGANKVLEVRDSLGVLQTLSNQKVDVLICDLRLPPHGGLKITHAIRRNTENENRTVPILLMTSDTREVTVKNARDVGASMVIAKPLAPSNLYDRLAWVAFNARQFQFIDTETYFGPDRRFKIEGYPGGVGRRKGDHDTTIGADSGPAMSQDEIDSLLNMARTGQQ
jgi:two-component system, chemotaxis family, chemotaxis protein CheY